MPAMLRFAIRLAEFLLLIALTFVAARLIWLVAFGASASDFEQDSLDRSAGTVAASSYVADMSRLRDASLFTDPRTAAVDPAIPAEIPETRLALVLRGVRRGATAEAGGAIIQTPDNRQRFFRVGAEILDGVTLEAVLVDHVRISRRGIAEVLYLRAEDAAAARAAAGPAGSASTAPSVNAPVADRRGRVEDVAGLFQVRGLYSGETLTGYRIEGGNDAMLSVLGLRVSDVVTAIEGRPVSAIEDLSGLLDREDGRESIQFSISRGGLPLTISRTLPQ
ncbi:type II secretion system protein N [Maricaulis maris]|uniref:Type II secretion system protein C (GspC) n=1 Tax=Maricaulis maris TaxID=74318 RepID=A0A495D319_9PROT|nr:type II secretion system protein N [Maricaulis maris]RKQ96165.1 type II secretion system protein C (GspC) [Maricaulis maris]